VQPGTYDVVFSPSVPPQSPEITITKEDPTRGVCCVTRLTRDTTWPERSALSLPTGWRAAFVTCIATNGALDMPCRNGGLSHRIDQIEGQITFTGDRPTTIDSLEVLLKWGDQQYQQEYLHGANMTVR
jgi:hypothetical protein